MKITEHDWKVIPKKEDFVDESIEITEIGGVSFYSRTFNERKDLPDDTEHSLNLEE